MFKEILQVEEIPAEVECNSLLEITSTNVSYFTHSFFKYPCKFIPQIPKWAIKKYTKENDTILDCFAGSGTTLVEAGLLKRNALGVDFDKLSQLLCLTKTIILDIDEILYLLKVLDKLCTTSKKIQYWTPDIHNIEHWFSNENIRQLSVLKHNIDNETNIRIKNFLLVCFASIIKKVSKADETSPKPYVSSRFSKKKYSANDEFLKSVKNNIGIYKKYSDYKLGKANIISDDARNIKNKKYQNKIDLAITSPPYINAFDYVRSLRLENAWLNYYGDTNITQIKRNQIGTESIPASFYNKEIPQTGINELDCIIKRISCIDKKRAYVVYKYFCDMEANLISVKKLLKKNAHYVIVVGDSVIRGVEISTHNILILLAERNGFELINKFSYLIKNRYLRIPRANRGGLIKYDWIIDLRK